MSEPKLSRSNRGTGDGTGTGDIYSTCLNGSETDETNLPMRRGPAGRESVSGGVEARGPNWFPVVSVRARGYGVWAP